MILRFEVEIDDAKADAYNAGLYDEDEQEIAGDGRSLVRDIVRDDAEAFFDEHSGLDHLIVRRIVTLDGEEIT